MEIRRIRYIYGRYPLDILDNIDRIASRGIFIERVHGEFIKERERERRWQRFISRKIVSRCIYRAYIHAHIRYAYIASSQLSQTKVEDIPFLARFDLSPNEDGKLKVAEDEER